MKSVFCLSVAVVLGAGALVFPEDEVSHDSRVTWLKQNSIAVKSIDPVDEDFSDLMPLIDKIGESRVVMLGEQSHGDGSTFLAKSRLIKFLHQEMGFDVLAWESGIFDCREFDAALNTDEPHRVSARKGLFRIWSWSEQCQNLFEYAKASKRTTRPLEMAGFDCQLSGSKSYETYSAYMIGLINKINPHTLSKEDRDLFEDWMERSYLRKSTRNEAESKAVKDLLAKIHDTIENTDLADKVTEREQEFALQCTENLQALQAIRDSMDENGTTMKGVLIRDEMMGKNLIWLANHRYPDQKIIVWAASSHIARSWRAVKDLEMESESTYVPMGTYVSDELGDDVYVIGFIAHSGEYGRINRAPNVLRKSPEGSLDDLCNKTGKEFLFLDLRGSKNNTEWLQEELVARPFGYSPYKGKWGDAFDGMFFTREMIPSTRDPLAAPLKSN